LKIFLKNKIPRSRDFIAQFFKFAVVGTLGTLIDFGLLNLLVISTGAGVYFSATLSFIAAVVNNFFLNKYWTFKSPYLTKKSRDLFIQFLIVSVIGLGLNLTIMYLLMDIFHLGHERYNFAKAAAVVVVLVWNFLANKFWTFKVNKA